MLDLPSLEKGAPRTFVGDRDLGLAAAVGLRQLGRLVVALLLEPRPVRRVVGSELVPVDLRPLVGKGLLQGRTALLPPSRRLLDGTNGTLGHAHGLFTDLRGLAGLLVDEGNALLLVLAQQWPQPLGHV